jgi:hypothetical protein
LLAQPVRVAALKEQTLSMGTETNGLVPLTILKNKCYGGCTACCDQWYIKIVKTTHISVTQFSFTDQARTPSETMMKMPQMWE